MVVLVSTNPRRFSWLLWIAMKLRSVPERNSARHGDKPTAVKSVAVCALAFALSASAAEARQQRPHRHYMRPDVAAVHHDRGGRPHAWCGWYMRGLMGVADANYNLAANWAHWGRSAGGPVVGAVVVW